MNDIDHLRRLIEKTLLELGMPDAHWSCVKTTSLDQTPHAKAARDGVLAVWLADRNILEFRAENGELLKTVSLGKEKAECGRAA
jgi:hypothetical protein